MNENENNEVQVIETESSQKKKGANEFWAKASSMGKKVADNVQKNATALSEKAKADNHQRRIEKYNPLFIKEYRQKSFILPQLIHIVDDASVQKIDVCVGAIGWREKTSDVEILFLSIDFAVKSGLVFFPNLATNSLFCQDSYDATNYINIDRIFAKAHEEKLAELEHIAYALGAKSCAVELVESDELTQIKSRDGQAGMKIFKASSKEKSTQATSHVMSGRTISTFKGNDSPVRPSLKWFKNDHNILNLIEMRCSDKNALQSRTLVLEGASSMTMEQNMARNIDIATTKIGLNLHASMEKQHRKECSSKLIFEVVFE